jgi:hypothetical protein
MRFASGLLLGLVLLGCSKPSGGGEASASAAPAASTAPLPATTPKRARSKLDCAELLTKMEEVSRKVNMPMKTTPGSWGKVPAELQVVPPGGKHCGSVDLLEQAVIASGLEGKALESFYAPLFGKLGCQPLVCEEATSGDYVQTRCNCRGDGMMGSVNTDTGNETYTLAVVPMTGILGRKKKP